MDDLTTAQGSGSHTVAGMEYQIDVSIWLALDLVLSSKRAREIVLEPPSQEDVEAEITAASTIDGYTLVVQAKLRSGEPWRATDVARLLTHGGPNRVAPAARLSDKRIRYLLITSAGVTASVSNLEVTKLGVWPKQGIMPSTVAKILPDHADGRVAIIGNQDWERIRIMIKDLLIEAFRVPRARWEQCRTALEREARQKISIGGSGRWSREELQAIIIAHEGYLASSPDLDIYVRPTNWSTLKGAVENRHALLIVGQSGTGKTTTVDALWDEIKRIRPDLARIRITRGPEEFRARQIDAPAFYDIEDPWGRYRFEPDRRPWNVDLANAFASARHDRIIVATSRRDVADASGAFSEVAKWAVSLEAEQYRPTDRHRIYRSRASRLHKRFKSLAFRFERDVLARLKTPLEIQKFFDAIAAPELAEEENPAATVYSAIDRAQEGAIEKTIIDQIEARRATKPAAVVWGLLKVSPSLSLSMLPEIDEALYELDRDHEEGTSPLIRSFVAARNLRQSEDRVSYYHPRVEAGVAKAIANKSLPAKRVLSQLADVLIALDQRWGDREGLAAAAELAAAARNDGLDFRLSKSAQEKIDAWLESELRKGGSELETTLKLAEAVGSSRSTLCELARWLRFRPERTFPGFLNWGQMPVDDNWIARVRADADTQPLLAAFVRSVLPFANDRYPDDFGDKLQNLAGDLSDAFFDAAMTVIHFGASPDTDAILEAALADLDRFDAIAEQALAILASTDEDVKRWQKINLAIVNEEYGEAYADHMSGNDDGYTARSFLKAYVGRLRSERGWQTLDNHRQRQQLLTYWLDLLWRLSKPLDEVGEMLAALSAGYGSADEGQLWSTVARHWCEECAEPLVQRVRNGHDDPSISRAAIQCMVARIPDRIGAIATDLMQSGNTKRLVSMALEVAACFGLQSFYPDAPSDTTVRSAMESLPGVFAELAKAAVDIDTDREPRLSSEAVSILHSISDANEAVRRLRLQLQPYFGHDVRNDVVWLLDRTDDKATAVEAIETAIRLQLTDVIEAALSNRFAHVVAAAVAALGSEEEDVVSDRILASISTSGRPARKALLDLLEAKPNKAHLPTLIELARDTWSGREYYEEEQDYPLARRAAGILFASGGLDPAQLEELYQLSLETQDSDLCRELMQTLVRYGAQAFQRRLYNLAVSGTVPAQRRAAIKALAHCANDLDEAIIGSISIRDLTHNAPGVSVELVMLLGERGSAAKVREAAAALAASGSRRVFVILLVAATALRDRLFAEELAENLPPDHLGRRWALDQPIGVVDDDALDDLGDIGAVDQVLPYLQAT